MFGWHGKNKWVQMELNDSSFVRKKVILSYTEKVISTPIFVFFSRDL